MWAPPGSPGSRAAGPGLGQHEAGAGFGSSSRGAGVTQDGRSGANAGEPEKRGRDPRRLHRPPSPLPLPPPAAAGPGGRGRTGGTAGAEACGDGRGRGHRGGTAGLQLGRHDPAPRFGTSPRVGCPGGVPGRARGLSASPVSPCLFSRRREGTVAVAHLGCIRRRLRREMRRALLTGPRWGEIYALLSGTEPHKSSPPALPSPRGCSANVPVPLSQRPGRLMGMHSWMGCLGYLGSSWPSGVVAAYGTWPVGDRGVPGFTWMLWGYQGTAVPIRAAGPALAQPGSVPLAGDASSGSRFGDARARHPQLCSATWAGTGGPLPLWRAASLALCW